MDELKRLDKLRKQCPYIIYLGIFSFILNIIFMIIFLVNNKLVFLILLIIFLLLTIILFLTAYSLYNKVKYDYRNFLLKEIETKIIPNARYTLNSGLPLDEIYKSGLLQVADRSRTKNLMVGKVFDIDFFASNLHLEERRVHNDKNGNRNVSYVTYFNGKVLIFDFFKKFKSNLIITSSSPVDEHYKIKKLTITNTLTLNNYKIYGDNIEDAKLILDKDFTENLMKLGKCNKDSLMLSINKSKLYIAIDNIDINLEKFDLFTNLSYYPVTYVMERMDIIKTLIKDILSKDVFK